METSRERNSQLAKLAAAVGASRLLFHPLPPPPPPAPLPPCDTPGTIWRLSKKHLCAISLSLHLSVIYIYIYFLYIYTYMYLFIYIYVFIYVHILYEYFLSLSLTLSLSLWDGQTSNLLTTVCTQLTLPVGGGTIAPATVSTRNGFMKSPAMYLLVFASYHEVKTRSSCGTPPRKMPVEIKKVFS